jgi:hypothetical protein
MSSRWRGCLTSAGLQYGSLGGPRQCVRRSRRASPAPRRSILPLSAGLRIDQIAEKSNQLAWFACPRLWLCGAMLLFAQGVASSERRRLSPEAGVVGRVSSFGGRWLRFAASRHRVLGAPPQVGGGYTPSAETERDNTIMRPTSACERMNSGVRRLQSARRTHRPRGNCAKGNRQRGHRASARGRPGSLTFRR